MMFDTIWTDARLLTLPTGQQGLGAVERGAVAAVGGRIAFAGPMADLPSGWDAKERVALDARWVMAYSASLGLDDRRYYDTLAADGPVAHPMFPVCYEWPAAVALRGKTVREAWVLLGVHATHHVVIHRRPRADDRLLTRAQIIEVRPSRAGTTSSPCQARRRSAPSTRCRS